MLPLFDNIKYLHQNIENFDIRVLPNQDLQEDYRRALDFLKSYIGSLGTFNSYRREVERLLQWCWHIKKTSLKKLKRDDIEQYMHFCQNPPQNWIGLKKHQRFIEKDGKRDPNPNWLPFVVALKKSSRKQGHLPQVQLFSLSQGAIKEIFAILGTFFNFLIAEEYLFSNPIALIRQKSKFVRKRQQAEPVRRLSITQWEAVLNTTQDLALENPEQHERTLFILSLLFGMYLRISELAASERWIPTMNDFAKDSQGFWWFTTVGKGNKERQIAVSDAMLASLKRWRTFLGLSPLPSVADNSSLLPKLRGKGPMSDTAPIRRIVQHCFDHAEIRLRRNNQTEEADTLQDATVHWLRHTGISEDVKLRPREHVRDDAGHSSSETTDRYVDDEREARHASARRKKISLNSVAKQ